MNGARPRRRLSPGYGARSNPVLGNESENLTVLVIRNQPNRALRIHLNIPDAATEVGEYALILLHPAADDPRPNEAFSSQAAVQQITTPLRKQVARVNGEP